MKVQAGVNSTPGIGERAERRNDLYWTTKLDVAGSYPNGEVALNTSKETTVRELMNIEGIDEQVYRMENMGLSAGHVNSMAWCRNMLNFPSHEEMLQAFLHDHQDVQLRVSFTQARDAMHGEFAQSYPLPDGFR